MNIFETVKRTVGLKRAAEYYGMKVQRNGMCCCLFHHDHHPSMKLNETYFYCFSCGARGDVIDLTAQLFHLRNYEAAQKLAADFGIDPDDPDCPPAALQKPVYRQVRNARQEEQDCLRMLCDYLWLLRGWKICFAPQNPEDLIDEHFVEACRMLDRVEYLTDIFLLGSPEECAKTLQMLRSDGTMEQVEKRLNEAGKKVEIHGYPKAA